MPKMDIQITIALATSFAAIVEATIALINVRRTVRKEKRASIVFEHLPRTASDRYPHILVRNVGQCTAINIDIHPDIDINLQTSHIDQLVPEQPVELPFQSFGFSQVVFRFSYTDRLGKHSNNTFTMLAKR